MILNYYHILYVSQSLQILQISKFPYDSSLVTLQLKSLLAVFSRHNPAAVKLFQPSRENFWILADQSL